MMLTNIAYYIIYTSALCFYGIGSNRALSICEHPRQLWGSAVKMLLTISSSTALTYLVAAKVLLPANLTEVYPFAAVLIFSSISIFIESIIRVATRHSASEYTVSLLSVLLGVNESTSVFESVVIACLCELSFFFCIFLLYAVRRRIGDKQNLLIVSLAIIIIILTAWNVSWLNQGGIL